MKCNNCQSEWNGVKELDCCPFCGADLKPQIKDKNFNNVSEFLNYVISVFGLDVLRDSRKLISLFADLAPTLEQEKNLLRIATESGVYKDILATNSDSESEKQACVARCKITLESKYFMQGEWAEKAIFWLTDYLGWKVKAQITAPPKPVQPVVQQVQKPVTPPVQQVQTPVVSQQTTTTPKPVQPTAPTPRVPSLAPQGVAAVSSVHNARMFQKRLAIGCVNYDKNKKTHIIAINKDGKVVATGDNSKGQCNVSDWKDIIAVAAGYKFSLGLKKDGTVLCVGDYPKTYGRGEEISSWKDIVAISANFQLAVGLKKDGTVVAIGSKIDDRKDIFQWKDIIDIFAGDSQTVGLKKDGAVVTTCDLYTERVSKFTDIVAVSSKTYDTVCLDEYGDISVTYKYKAGRYCWSDIISISSSYSYTVGLKKDGTVVTEGENEHGRCNVSKWRDIVAVWAGEYFTIGLKKDGTLVTTYKKIIGNKFNFDNWKLF